MSCRYLHIVYMAKAEGKAPVESPGASEIRSGTNTIRSIEIENLSIGILSMQGEFSDVQKPCLQGPLCPPLPSLLNHIHRQPHNLIPQQTDAPDFLTAPLPSFTASSSVFVQWLPRPSQLPSIRRTQRPPEIMAATATFPTMQTLSPSSSPSPPSSYHSCRHFYNS